MQEADILSETGSLISSGDVNGTRVFGRNADHIGTIDHLMIDRETGKVAYAVMTFGGLFGIGQDSYPIPWSKLSYDVSLDGYRTDIDPDQVRAAPVRPDTWDRRWEKSTYDHYGVLPYWM